MLVREDVAYGSVDVGAGMMDDAVLLEWGYKSERALYQRGVSRFHFYENLVAADLGMRFTL